MATVTVSLPADGTTADVSDVNTPITTIVNTINGNLDDSNIAANAAIDSSKLAGGTSGMFNVFISYTPVWTKLTGTAPSLGNGTLTGYYKQVGKLVTGYFNFVIGNTSAVNGAEPWSFSLPVTASSNMTLQTSIGSIYAEDAGNNGYQGIICLNSTTQVVIRTVPSTTIATVGAVGGASPFTWGAGDFVRGSFTYEAA